MEFSTNDLLQAGANYSAALTENHENSAKEALPQPQNLRLSVWDWQKYYESAANILIVRTETKGDVTYSVALETNEEIKELSKQVLVQLLKLASNTLNHTTSIYN